MSSVLKHSRRASVSQNLFRGIFAGWGESQVVAVHYDKDKNHLLTLADTKAAWEGKEPNASTIDTKSYQHIEEHRRSMGLSLLKSIPIVGCDLLSSVLYTSGGVISVAGKVGPAGLVMVSAMLFFYRKVYQEVVSAIPNNGGVYNALLNTSTKRLAALAACLSILSYTATALVSSFESIVYLSKIWNTDIRGGTILVQGVFACITALGVGESASVSLVLFTMHVTMLTLLSLWCIAYGFKDNFHVFMENTRSPYPEVLDTTGKELTSNDAGYAIFYGFSAGLLGISGFESAANYVEEMKDCDVYVRTVDIMWVFSGIFNPLISFVALFVLPLEEIYAEPSGLLASLGDKVGGAGFKGFIAVDAFCVLCGAVLTAYVGIVGLVRRLAQDKILPNFLLVTNSRGTNHRIIFCFFLLTASLFLALFDPNKSDAITVFGGVYALAFLLVMLAFALACLALKIQRPSIPRLVITSYWGLFVCIACVSVGIVGNILLAPVILQWFFIYMAGFMFVVFFMFQRINAVRTAMWAIRLCSMSKEDRKKNEEYKQHLIAAHRQQEMLHVETEAAQAARKASLVLLSSQAKELESKADDRKNGMTTTGETQAPFPPPPPPPPPLELSLSPQSPTDSTAVSDPSQSLNLAALAKAKQEYQRQQRANSPSSMEDTGAHVPLSPGADGTIRAKTRVSSSVRDLMMIRAPNRNSSSMLMARRAESVSQLQPGFSTWLLDAHHDMTNQEYTCIIPSQDKFQHTELKPIDQEEIDELDRILVMPVLGTAMRYCLEIQNQIVSEPMVFLARSDDPVCLHEAIDYVKNNELTQNLFVVHFVDDREIVDSFMKASDDVQINSKELEASANRHLLRAFMAPPESDVDGRRKYGDPNSFLLARAWPKVPASTSQLIVNVALLDAFYSSIRVNCLIIRGSCFCPEAVRWLSRFLNIPLNSMLMGMPDMAFKFPISDFTGVRIVLQPSSSEQRSQTRERLVDVHAFTEEMKKKAIVASQTAKHKTKPTDVETVNVTMTL